jgi:2-desacetyl-2-hydroxyethyl bacteriochlorophyllide A dehydrogenase
MNSKEYALVFRACKDVVLEPVIPPVLGDGVVALTTEFSAISQGTERMWLDGTATALQSGRKTYPYFPGYSVVGRVVNDVPSRGFAAGDRVFATQPHRSFLALDADKGHSFYKVIAETPAEDLALVTLLGTALHCVQRARVGLGDSVVVVGSGLLAILVVKLLQATLPIPVTAVVRRAKAHGPMFDAMGVSWTTDAASVSGSVFIDATGTSDGMAAALQGAAPGGRVVGAGFYTEPFAVDGEAFFTKEVEIISVKAGGPPSRTSATGPATRNENLDMALALVQSGRITSAGIPTAILPVADHKSAYDDLLARQLPQLVLLDWRELHTGGADE